MTSFKHAAFWALNLLGALCWPGLGYGQPEPTVNGKPLSHWIKQLDEGGPNERRMAAFYLLTLGPKAAPAMPALAKALEGEKVDNVRISMASAVARIGPCDGAKAAVPALVEMLKEDKTNVSGAAADALKALGPSGKEAVPTLITCLKHEDLVFRGKCASALGAVGREDNKVLPVFQTMLGDNQLPIRRMAVLGFRELGKPGVPLLIDHARKGLHYSEVLRALESLESIGPDASEAVPGLIEVLGHENPDYRRAAARALGGIGPAAKDALPTLERMRREDRDAGQAAAEAIKKIKR